MKYTSERKNERKKEKKKVSLRIKIRNLSFHLSSTIPFPFEQKAKKVFLQFGPFVSNRVPTIPNKIDGI